MSIEGRILRVERGEEWRSGSCRSLALFSGGEVWCGASIGEDRIRDVGRMDCVCCGVSLIRYRVSMPRGRT